MIIGFSGTRKGTSENLIEAIFSILLQRKSELGGLRIVVGDCKGVDEQVYGYCKKNGIPVGVFVVRGNSCGISYQPDLSDIVEYVGSLRAPLRKRLALRTLRLVDFLRNKGRLVAIYDRYYDEQGRIRTPSKGTLLAVNTAKKWGIPVIEFPATKKGALILLKEYYDLSEDLKEFGIPKKVKRKQKLDAFERSLLRRWKKLRAVVALSCPAFGIEIRPRSKGLEKTQKGKGEGLVVPNGSER